jgi:hypothetical protein
MRSKNSGRTGQNNRCLKGKGYPDTLNLLKLERSIIYNLEKIGDPMNRKSNI